MLMLGRVLVLVAGLLVGVGLMVPGVALAGEGCPNEQLRAEDNSQSLPDCRAYEMVTPAEKNSALVSPTAAQAVAADGSSLAGFSNEGFAGIVGNEVHSEEYYRFTRGAGGWVTRGLTPADGILDNLGVGDSVWGPGEKAAQLISEPPIPQRLRLVAADGSVSEIGPGVGIVGVAAEAVNGLLVTGDEEGLRWPFDPTLSGGGLYEYKGTGNTTPTLVGVSGGAGSTTLVSQCGTSAGGQNTISEDGSVVFFTAAGADSNACGGVQPAVNELFARIDEDSTVAISEPSTADCPLCDESVPEDAVFRGASADGSKVFFTTTQQLLGHDTSVNLYEYDFDPPAGQPRVVRVSGGGGSVSEPTAEVQGVTNVSQDGSHVYFIAKGVLTTVVNSAGERAQPGGENLYVWERDAEYPTGRTVFITGCGGGGGQVTPDGRFLVFTSACHLTAGDTSTARQVFQYDAQSGSMTRVSVGLDGYDDNGNLTGEDPPGELGAGIVGQGGNSGRGGAIERTMSDDGSYVFFQSPVGLTPGALNLVQISKGAGTPFFAQNVYEFHDGRVWLIGSDSSIAEYGDPVLVGVSASGGDVFFRTGDRLVGQDTDTQIDFYDARVGGGFPAPVTPAGCVGDVCQGSPSGAPVFGVPSSAAFAGGGNLVPAASVPVVVATKALTRAQKLARALKACAKEPRRKRAGCEVRARRSYGRAARAVKSDRRSA
jgi:hypothetical protein